jgi:drug/metabolite transporter (DMT)-like permease
VPQWIKEVVTLSHVLTALYLLLIACKSVWAGSLTRVISPWEVALFTFGITAGFFLILEIVRSRRFSQSSVQRKNGLEALFLLNILTTVAWLGFLFGIRLLDPPAAAAIIVGIGPVVLLAITTAMRSGDSVSAGSALCVLGAQMVLFLAASTGEAVTKSLTTDPKSAAFGITAAIIGGIGVVGNTVLSKKLNIKGWTPSELMAHRFYALTLVSLAFCLMEAQPLQGIRAHWIDLTAIAVGGVLVPLYLLQTAIAVGTPTNVTLMLCFGPVVTLGLEWTLGSFGWLGGINPDSPALVAFAILLTSSTSFGVIYLEHRRMSRARRSAP